MSRYGAPKSAHRGVWEQMAPRWAIPVGTPRAILLAIVLLALAFATGRAQAEPKLGVEDARPTAASAQIPQVEKPLEKDEPRKEEDSKVEADTVAMRYRLDFGDRLKIAFYDRDDISKEYRIGEGGVISIPTVGTFRIANLTTSALETLLTDAYERVTLRRIPVVVEVVERRPFFVVGLVSKPGPYPYVPGMTVLHAVAYAGGIFRGGTSSWIATDLTREIAKQSQTRDELARLLLRRARLFAERGGDDTLKTPERLAEVASPDVAQDLLTQERLILKRRNATYARQLAAAVTNVEASRRELTALQEQRAFITEQRKATDSRLAELKSLEAKQLTPRARVLEMETNLGNFNRQDRELSANIARMDRTVSAAEREESVLQLELQMRIEEELGTVDRQIAQLDVAFKSSNSVVEQLSGVPASALNSTLEANVKYEVLREMAGKQEFLPVRETDPVLPGDILRVQPQTLTK